MESAPQSLRSPKSGKEYSFTVLVWKSLRPDKVDHEKYGHFMASPPVDGFRTFGFLIKEGRDTFAKDHSTYVYNRR